MATDRAALTTAPPYREKIGGAVPRADFPPLFQPRRKPSAQCGAVGAIPPLVRTGARTPGQEWGNVPSVPLASSEVER